MQVLEVRANFTFKLVNSLEGRLKRQRRNLRQYVRFGTTDADTDNGETLKGFIYGSVETGLRLIKITNSDRTFISKILAELERAKQ